MNAVATAGNQLGALAGLSPQPPINLTAHATPIFLNLISALFGHQLPDAKLTVSDSNGHVERDTATLNTAAPKQIAEAIIRSMLGDAAGLNGSNQLQPELGGAIATKQPLSGPIPEHVSEGALPVIVATNPQVLMPPLLTVFPEVLTQASLPSPAQPGDTIAMGTPAMLSTDRKTLKNGPKVSITSKQQILPALATAATLPVPVVAENLSPVFPRAEGPQVTKTSSQPSPLQSKTVEAAAAPPQSQLAFSAQLTPLGSSDSDSLNKAAPDPAPAASDPAANNRAAKQPVSLPTAVIESAPQLGHSQAEPVSTPSEAPPTKVVAPAKELSGRSAVEMKTKAPLQLEPKTPARIVAAAVPVSSGDFNRSFEAPAAVPAPSAMAPETKSESLFSTAETLRTSEPLSIAPPQAQSSPVQEITLRIARPEAAAVDLQVTQRAGEIQVSVHTPDTALQTSLREDLSTLTNSLGRAGYHTETFVPRSEASSQMNSREERQPQQDSSGRGGSGSSPEDETRDGRRQQQNQNPRDQRPQRWLDELETQT